MERQETTFCTPDSWAECRTLSLMWMFVLWEKGHLSGSCGQGSPNSFTNNSLITPETTGALVWLWEQSKPHPCLPITQFREHSTHRDPSSANFVGAHPKIQVGADVFEEASYHGGQVDDMSGLVPLKQGFGLGAAPGRGNFGIQQGQQSKLRCF